jgi:uncharacterized RDD family membrane protein YckC
MFCSKCGAQIADTAAFCSSCGQATGAQPPVQPSAQPPAQAPTPRGIPLAPSGFGPAGGVSSPPSVPTAPLTTGSVYAPAVPMGAVAYAGFWLRFVAFILDALILGIPMGMILFSQLMRSGVLNSITTFPPASPEEITRLVGTNILVRFSLLAIFAEWLYYALLESSAWQATLGKKALGLYATDLGGRRMTFGRATGRYFGMVMFRIIPLLGPLLLFPIDCICAGVTEKRQALHDMIAGCLVVRKV